MFCHQQVLQLNQIPIVLEASHDSGILNLAKEPLHLQLDCNVVKTAPTFCSANAVHTANCAIAVECSDHTGKLSAYKANCSCSAFTRRLVFIK